MHIEDFSLPGGWVSSVQSSGLWATQVLQDCVSCLTSAGWKISNIYRARFWFVMAFSYTTVPTQPVTKGPAPYCGALGGDSRMSIDNLLYIPFDPYRQEAPSAPCVGFPLGLSAYETAQNFLAVVNASPYMVTMRGSPGGVWDRYAPPYYFFSAVAKEPGHAGNDYQFGTPGGPSYQDASDAAGVGIDAYGGYEMTSPVDHAGNTFKLRLWQDGLYALGFKCYDPYGGETAKWSLWHVDRSRGQASTPLSGGGWFWYFWRIIATEDSLCLSPYAVGTQIGHTQSGTTAPYTTASGSLDDSFLVARPVPTQDAIDQGMESGLVCWLPMPQWGDFDPSRIVYTRAWVSLNGTFRQITEFVGENAWSLPAIVIPRFNFHPIPDVETITGDILNTCAFVAASDDTAAEAGIVGKLNSCLVVDKAYPLLSQLSTPDGTDWYMIASDLRGPAAFSTQDASLFMALSTTPCGSYRPLPGVPGGTTPTARPISYKVDPSGGWTLNPPAADAIWVLGGEAGLSVDVHTQDPGWTMEAGGAFGTGLAGHLYFRTDPRLDRHCAVGLIVRIWGFPNCSHVGHTYTYTLRATDSLSQIVDMTYSFTVTEGTSPAIFPRPGAIPNGTHGVAYSQTFTIGCGTVYGSINWRGTGLPPGLTLGASSGILSGTPTTIGAYEFDIAAMSPGIGGAPDTYIDGGRYTMTVL